MRFRAVAFSSRAQIIGVLGVVMMALWGCGKPFNVKTKTDLPPASYAAATVSDGISIQAQPVTDEDFLYERFDANLISAGVFPVRVMLKNSSERTVDLRKARFEIRQHAGRSFKSVEARAAFKQLISYYEIKAYSKGGFKESLGTFSEYELDLKTPVGPGQSRQGLLFFLVPNEAARATGLRMVVSRITPASNTPAELRLN
jgi:hypothetical protein